MNDYISREAAKEYVKSQDGRPFIGITIGEAFRMMLDEVPAADVVEVVHGEWLGTEYDGYADGNPVYVEFACSVCGYLIDTDEGDRFTKYCPQCGARMDGGDGDG